MVVDVILSNCDAPKAVLNKPADQAVWYSGDKSSYALAFYSGPPGSSSVSPFAPKVFTVNPGSPTPSGGIRVDALEGDYNYRVVGDSGCNHDPIIRIGP